MTGRAKKEWETTFNAMSDGIFIFDNSGQLIRVNRAGAAMEDTWPHLMLGRRCCDILRTSEGSECIVEKTINEGRSVTLEIVPERFNRPLLVTVEPVMEKGSQTIGAVCTARDRSEFCSNYPRTHRSEFKVAVALPCRDTVGVTVRPLVWNVVYESPYPKGYRGL